MRAKTPRDSMMVNYVSKVEWVPGPGEYNTSDILSRNQGKIVDAKYQSAVGGLISKSGRTMDWNHYLKNGQMETPAPGNYNSNLELNSNGSYLYYKWKSSGAPKFPQSSRLMNLDTSETRKSKISLILIIYK